MLKLKYLYANFELAEEALRNWTYDRDTLSENLALFRISSNAIYPFRQDGELCFLRLAPTEEKQERNVTGELAFIRYLVAEGYPALRPIDSNDGETVCRLPTRWGPYYASAFHCVAGVPVEDTDFAGPIMVAYGRALGRLHALSERYVPTVRKWDYRDALDWVEDTLREQKAPAAVKTELAAVRRTLDALPVEKGGYGLIHYDFEPDNVFFDADTGACSAIDFDDGMYHWYALDVQRSLDSLCDYLQGKRLEAAQEAFLKGYATERVCPERTETVVRAMHRFVNLYRYARLSHCLGGDAAAAGEPEWMIALRAKLNRIMDGLEAEMKATYIP